MLCLRSHYFLILVRRRLAGVEVCLVSGVWSIVTVQIGFLSKKNLPYSADKGLFSMQRHSCIFFDEGAALIFDACNKCAVNKCMALEQ